THDAVVNREFGVEEEVNETWILHGRYSSRPGNPIPFEAGKKSPRWPSGQDRRGRLAAKPSTTAVRRGARGRLR
ncbi:hypothetical protein AAHH78_36915, partial [Burkholderia pseudomallei]